MPDKTPPDEAFHLTGDRLGKFMILSELGRGSMGVVYEAFQEDLKRKVALKILPANITLDAKQVRRFHREAESVARLRHDNVIQIYEVGQVGTTHYFAMELVEGRPLDGDQVRDREAILHAARIARDAARGLAHAHEKGVIHRDIKPGNLLVDRNGRVVVTDFGLARLTDSASLTSTDAIVGTPKYMSPEQILVHTQRPVDGRADVYSLGATLYHVIAGRPPFEAPTVQGFIKAILEERPPSPRRFNRQIPFDLATIVLRCLEKDPADRYASAKDLADDLDRFLAGDPILAKPKGAVALAFEGLRRHRGIAALAAAVALAVVLALVLSGKAAEESELRSIAANDDLDVARSQIEDFCARQPGHAVARRLRARIYRDRAEKALQGREPYFEEILADIEKAGERGSFWHLMILVELDRIAEAKAAAETLPEGDPLRRVTLARIAVREGRNADAIALLPELIPTPKEALVFSALTRGLAYKAMGRAREAVGDLSVAVGEEIQQAWLRWRVLGAYGDVGGELKDVLDFGRTVTASLRALAEAPPEQKVYEHLVESVLRLANQPAVPSSTLATNAQRRLETAKGEDRAVAHLLLAVAQISDKPDLAIGSIDQAEAECTPELEPYVYWTRALALRLQGNLPRAVESVQQAIELARALKDGFPDLQYLCEHAALLAKDAPPAQKQRASQFLREQLQGMEFSWVSDLLNRLSAG